MEQKLTPAIAVEQSLELQVLGEVSAVRSMVRELTIKLLGDATIESQTGRLPALEAKVTSLNDRVSRLERLVWLATGGGMVIGFFLHLLVK